MEATAAFPNLLAPGRIGSLVLRNRMVMPPMGVNFGTSDGYVTQRTVDYYEARAAGGVGAIIVEFSCVEFSRGKGHDLQLSIDDDKFLPGLSDLASAIKRHGARAFIQLHHAGREAHLSHGTTQPVAPSPIRSINPRMGEPRPLSVVEIKELVARFVEAADRACRAGFDGVEVHAAHTYLLSQFLSPLCNARHDDYGGSLANRARFTLEVVRGIRARLGRDYPIVVRLSGDEVLKGGITIEETCAVGGMLREAGADALHVSAGGLVSPKAVMIGTPSDAPGHLLHLPARVKQVVDLPVIGVGRINSPALAEAALREGKCDLVALGRALIADPEFPRKVAEGKSDEIRPCTACMHCLHMVGFENEAMICSINPAAGREREMAIVPAPKRQQVVVVGGGVAGMEAARVAARRGHEVTLFEREPILGGQLIAAATPPYKGDLKPLHEYYVLQMAKAGVVVHLGETPDPAAIAASRPDAVVVATGGESVLPPLPGADGGHVVFAEDVLVGKAIAGQRVVVIGGGMVGCETAEYLAAQLGRQVTIVEMLDAMAADMSPTVRGLLIKRLQALGVRLLIGAKAEGIEAQAVAVMVGDGRREVLPAETVVVAAGARPNGALSAALADKVPVVRVVGNAAQPRSLREAIHEGALAGLAI